LASARALAQLGLLGQQQTDGVLIGRGDLGGDGRAALRQAVDQLQHRPDGPRQPSQGAASDASRAVHVPGAV
jgi:hypothetical protein